MTIAFAGHASIPFGDKIKAQVKEQIKKHIIRTKSITFYLGGYGDFDMICAHVCNELKKEYDGIEVIYVTPYIRLSEQAKIREMQKNGWCDSSIYPQLESVPLKFAIAERNKWMMENADLVIAYVNRNYGGAYQSLQIAKRKRKKIINIFELAE